MSKSIEFKEKALLCIDTITSSAELIKSLTESKELFSQLYRISHCATDTTCKHPEWEQEVEDLYAKFVEEDML